MHHAVPQHTSTTSCALKGGMSTLCVALGDMHQHQPNATGSVTDTASLRFDETARSCNFASFNTALAAAASEQRRCSWAPPDAWQSCRDAPGCEVLRSILCPVSGWAGRESVAPRRPSFPWRAPGPGCAGSAGHPAWSAGPWRQPRTAPGSATSWSC